MKRANYRFIPQSAHDIIVNSFKSYFDEAGYTGDFVVGLSGGIDSSIVATYAVEVFGSRRVHGLILPSNSTSEESVDLAMKLSENLNISTFGLPIGKIVDDFTLNFEKNYSCDLSDLVKGNISARMRMVALMTASNEFGWKILNTGNRTEAMLGYCTLFGDTVGEYSPIGDVLKTEVFQLAEVINLISESRDGMKVIPQEIISRPPSAELFSGQTDEKEIGANYATIDRILWGTFAQDMTLDDLVCFGFNAGVVESVLTRVKKNAFKSKFYSPHPVVHPELN